MKKLTQKSQMYSGFASKQHELFYDKLVEKALKMLSERLVRGMERERQAAARRQVEDDNGEAAPSGLAAEPKSPESSTDLQFFRHVRKIQKYLSVLDKVKSGAPHLSESLEPLTKYIKEQRLSGLGEPGSSSRISMSTLTSNLSNLSNMSVLRTCGNSELGNAMIYEHQEETDSCQN